MRANDLFNAFDALDPDLLYEAHACTVSRRHISRRSLIAAAIVLTLIGTFVIYGIFLAPVSAIDLDAGERVTLTVNSRGNVLSAGSRTGLSGKSVDEAAGCIVGEMIDSGVLNENENTLLIGADRLSEKAQAELHSAVQQAFAESRFHGATVSLSCSDTGAKAAATEKLAEAVEMFTEDALRSLGVNDLNILLHEYEVSDGLTFTGEPSESGYIGKVAALDRAKANTDLTGADISVAYSVYRDRLVYLVRIVKGDCAEAYFINADDGVIATALKTAPEQLEHEIRAEVKGSTAPDPQTPSAQNAVPQAPQTFTDATEAPAADAKDRQPSTEATQPTFAPPLPTTAVPPTTAPTTIPFAPPQTPTSGKPTAAPTEPATAKPTETPPVDMDLLIIDAPSRNLETLNLDYNAEYSRGQSIPVTAFTPCWQWRMNFKTVIPAITTKQAIKMGEEDKQIALFCSYEDYVDYNAAYLTNNSDDGLSEYLTKIRTDYGVDKDFFRENALVVVYYSDFAVYPDENDSIKAIETDGDTAYVKLLRRHRPVEYTNVEIDVYKFVVAAAVKKTKNIYQLKLIVLTQSTE